MTAGRLRHRVTLQRLQPTTEPPTYHPETRQLLEEWVDLGTVWAAIEPLAGREMWLAKQVQANETYRITARYSALTAGIDQRDRLAYADAGTGMTRYFNISQAGSPGEMRVWSEWICSEYPKAAVPTSST